MAGWPLPPSTTAQAEIPSVSFGPPQDHPAINWAGNQPTIAPTADGGHFLAKAEGRETPRPNLQVKCLQDRPPPPPQRKTVQLLGSH